VCHFRASRCACSSFTGCLPGWLAALRGVLPDGLYTYLLKIHGFCPFDRTGRADADKCGLHIDGNFEYLRLLVKVLSRFSIVKGKITYDPEGWSCTVVAASGSTFSTYTHGAHMVGMGPDVLGATALLMVDPGTLGGLSNVEVCRRLANATICYFSTPGKDEGIFDQRAAVEEFERLKAGSPWCGASSKSAARSDEAKSKAAVKAKAAMGAKACSAATVKGNDTKSTAACSAAIAKGNATKGPEERSAATVKGKATTGAKARSAATVKGNATKGPAARSAATVKGHAKRALKAAQAAAR